MNVKYIEDRRKGREEDVWHFAFSLLRKKKKKKQKKETLKFLYSEFYLPLIKLSGSRQLLYLTKIIR